MTSDQINGNGSETAPADRVTVESLSFEQAQLELESIVEQLENQHTGLDEAIALWERGEALHAWCQTRLDAAAARIERLQVTPDEAAAVVAESGDDFAPEATPTSPAPLAATREDSPVTAPDIAAPETEQSSIF